MSKAEPTAWKRALLGLHGLAAVLPLLCMATIVVRAAGVGFAADRELYPRIENEAENLAPFMLATWQRPQGRVVLVLGLGDAAPTATSQSIGLLQAFAEAGVQLRLLSDYQGIDSLLPASVQRVNSLEEGLPGAHALMLFGEGKRFRELDFTACAQAMEGQLLFDLTARADGVAVDAAGLQLLSFGAPLGPPWLDPELRAYAAHLREKIPAEDGVLLVINERPATLSGRARWFLHLNHMVFPRRLYLENSFGASGTSVPFRQWVLDQRARGGFSGRGQQRWEPSPRDYSQVTRVGPVRTLNPAERAAIEAHDIQWVTFFTMNADFRLQDWETMTAEEALAGPK